MESRSQILLAQFEQFLRQGEQKISTEKPDACAQADMFALVGEMSALKSEIKKEARQHKEALLQFSGLLDTLQSGNQQLSQELDQQKVGSQEAVGQAERAILSEILDLQDRMEATINSLQQFQAPALERKASKEFRNSLQDGLEMTQRRISQLLENYQVEAVQAVGQVLDPHTMRVAEVRSEPAKPDGSILEELQRGYLHRGKLFRLAEVVANRH